MQVLPETRQLRVGGEFSRKLGVDLGGDSGCEHEGSS